MGDRRTCQRTQAKGNLAIHLGESRLGPLDVDFERALVLLVEGCDLVRVFCQRGLEAAQKSAESARFAKKQESSTDLQRSFMWRVFVVSKKPCTTRRKWFFLESGPKRPNPASPNVARRPKVVRQSHRGHRARSLLLASGVSCKPKSELMSSSTS
jgi:hypothetical protein